MIELIWEGSANAYEVHYRIEKFVSPSNPQHNWMELTAGHNRNSYKDMSISRNKMYKYQVIAFDPETSLQSHPMITEPILVPPKKIPWLFIILMVFLSILIIYLFLQLPQ
jgi:hypothetical protein